MAYYNQQEEDELEGQGPEQTGPQSGAVIDAGAAQSGNATPKTPTQDRSGSFVGISDYLNANKNQANKLGDQAGGVITGAADQARQGLNNLNQSFNQKAGSAVTVDDNLLGKVNQAETLQDQEKQQIKAAYNAQYGGPNSLADLGDEYSQTNQKLNKAKQNVEAAGTEEGRAGLITQINEKPRTAGITNFDNLLLQTGGGRNKVEQAAQANQDLKQDLLAQNNITAQQKASDLKAQNDLTRQKTQGAVGGAKQSLADSINQRLQEMRGGLTAQNNQIVQDLGDNAYGLDQATMDAFGLTDGQRSFGIDPSSYFTQGDISKINSENVARDEEYARDLALQELMGSSEGILNQAGRATANTANQYTSKVDKDRLAADLAAKEAGYASAPGGTTAKINEVTGGKLNTNLTPEQTLSTYLPASVLNSLGSLSGATVKDLQEKWIPTLRPYVQQYGPTGSPYVISQYLESLVNPYKVSSNNTFKKNQG